MDPVGIAVWCVESHFADDLDLEQIAAVSEVSRYHLVRAFGVATGWSVMRYVRARRLSVAARALAGGAPDILAVALDAGYGSHEAFTRAFRDQFGTTPEHVRAARHCENLKLTEPIRMNETPTANLEPPRFVTGRALLIAGLGERYTWETSTGIPALWQRFLPHLGLPGQVSDVGYGVCCNADDAGNFDYIAGVEVRDFSDLPSDFSRVRIPEHCYAVFSHRAHIATLRGTVSAIWNQWLPQSGYRAADAPNFECYGPEFDGRTGNGGLEIWVPIAS